MRGAGRHAVHGLDVEGLLAVPVLLVALGGFGDRAGRQTCVNCPLVKVGMPLSLE